MSAGVEFSVSPKEVTLQVIPIEDSIPLSDYEKRGIEGLTGPKAFFIWFIAFLIIRAVTVTVLSSLFWATMVVIAIHYMIKTTKIKNLEREKAVEQRKHVEQKNQNTMQSAINEAVEHAASLMKSYESSIEMSTTLNQRLTWASDWLSRAEREFQDNAFSPFWDAIEKAAFNLADFKNIADDLSRYASNYYKMLAGRKHTFPKFPVDLTAIPNPSSTLDELRRLVRLGQTNFQFANIWEHRRTREVLIAGFSTLGEAVNNIGTVVERSIHSLQDSISSDIARLAEEEIKSREEVDRRFVDQNRMLDNIQHGRKPSATDTPSKY